jgi:N-acetylmuramoyl-L-alanine amidase
MERIKNTFEVEKALVLPGNYSVLRETRTTAVLGEASYLTHRENERRLSLHGFLRLEAEAYFLGILDYFQRGVPVILNLTRNGDSLSQARPEVVGLVKDDECGEGIDPDSITLSLDGVVVAHHYDPLAGKINYIPENPLTNRRHALRLKVSNLRGNSAKPVNTFFYTSLPPCRVEANPLITTLPPDGFSRTSITAEIVDENLNPVADGTLVNFHTSAGRVVDSLAATRQGKAMTHLIADNRLGYAEVVVECDGAYGSCVVSFGEPKEKVVEVFVHDRKGNPLEGTEVVFGEEVYLITDALGYCFYKGNNDGGLEFVVWKNGYLPLKGFLSLGGKEVIREELVLEPVDHGLMWHKVIVIDPRGREYPFFSDDSRERSRAEINRETALCLRKMLELAGAVVFLTRGSDGISSPIERVIKANETRANLLISLDHRKGSSYLGYYFNSSKGKFLSRSIKQVIDDELSCKKLKMMESREFVLIHTTMPAVVINLDSRKCKKLPEDEEEIPWAEAKALYQGLRSYFKGMSQSR